MERTNIHISVLGMKLNIVQIDDVIEIMQRWIEEKEVGKYVVIANANDAVMSKKAVDIKEAVNNSSLSVPDGISLVLAARAYGYPLRRRVYGPDLMNDFLKISQDKGYRHFFYGSTEDTLAKLKAKLKIKFPGLETVGFYSPPFISISQAQNQEIIEKINRASPDVLWIGLGCPKQQLWMHEYKDKLKVSVMVGVGAAFDFLAKVKPQAPSWMRDHGLEWFFRLATEPRRLWKRYLVGNTLFLVLFLKEFLGRKISRKRYPD